MPAGNVPVPVLGMDSQFATTAGTRDKMSPCGNDPCQINFLERKELRNLHTVFRQFTVQERAAGLTVNQVSGHVFTTFVARSTLPRSPNAPGQLSKFR